MRMESTRPERSNVSASSRRSNPGPCPSNTKAHFVNKTDNSTAMRHTINVSPKKLKIKLLRLEPKVLRTPIARARIGICAVERLM